MGIRTSPTLGRVKLKRQSKMKCKPLSSKQGTIMGNMTILVTPTPQTRTLSFSENSGLIFLVGGSGILLLARASGLRSLEFRAVMR